jgi:hypothetical protein
VSERGRECERERERERERVREKDREKDRDRDEDGEIERDTHTERERERISCCAIKSYSCRKTLMSVKEGRIPADAESDRADTFVDERISIYIYSFADLVIIERLIVSMYFPFKFINV